MERKSERGEGKAGAIIWLVILAAVLWAGWNVAPAYIDNYVLKDKINEIARTPRGGHPDEKIMDEIWKYVRENRLDQFVKRTDFKISTLETSRRITVEYDRTVEVLPNFKKTLHFSDQVDQPLVY